jgi:hypothetical protein
MSICSSTTFVSLIIISVNMGSTGSKEQQQKAAAAAEAAALARQEETEAQNRLLLKAYQDGRNEALQSAIRAMDVQQTEDLMIGVGACLLTGVLASTYFGWKAGGTVRQYKSEQAKSTSLFAQAEQDLILERQRVRELATVNDSQAEMIKSQAALVERSREQIISIRAKAQFMRLQHAKLKRKHNNLMVEATTLRAQNGILHQRFIASTSGAILMACVAGAFAIASHGSHGAAPHVEDGGHVAASAPITVAPVVGADTAPVVADVKAH